MLGRTRRLGFAAAAAMVAGLGTAGVAQAIIVQPHPVPTWQMNGRVNAIAVSGTTVYLGGQFTSIAPPEPRRARARWRVTTSPPSA